MRVRIETDLSWANTHVWDDESGEEVRDVHHIALFGGGFPLDGFRCRLERYRGPEDTWDQQWLTLEDVELMEFTLRPPQQ